MKHESSLNSLWFTAPIAILLAIAAGGGVFIDGLYRDVPTMVAQAIGQDIISLAVVLPTLIVTALLAHRGSTPARLIWLGGLTYLVYSYVMFALDIKYNQLFLVYVALLGCSLYALIASLATFDMAGIKSCYTGKTPVKAVSIFLAILALLFYFLWLSEIIPALLVGKIPQSVQDSGTPTNAAFVLDMAWILPAFIITSVSLWRKNSLGYTLAGVVLSYFVLLVLAILSMVVYEMRDSQFVVSAQVAMFGTLFAIGFGILVWYLKGFRSPRVIEKSSDLLRSENIPSDL